MRPTDSMSHGCPPLIGEGHHSPPVIGAPGAALSVAPRRYAGALCGFMGGGCLWSPTTTTSPKEPAYTEAKCTAEWRDDEGGFKAAMSGRLKQERRQRGRERKQSMPLLQAYSFELLHRA